MALAKYINESKDGRITAEQYSKIFGYYDNMTGVTNPGVYQNVRDITKKYEDSVVNGFTSEFQGRIALKYKNTINDWDGLTYANDFEPAIKKYASANINFIKKEGIEKSVDKLITNMASANCDADGKKIDNDPDIKQSDAQKMKNDGTLVEFLETINYNSPKKVKDWLYNVVTGHVINESNDPWYLKLFK